MRRSVTVRIKLKDGTTQTFDDVLDIIKTEQTILLIFSYTTKILDYDLIKSVLITDALGREQING